MNHYLWEPLYLAATLETDNSKLPQRIASARAAINARWDRLPEGSVEERDAIANALAGLRSLREERMFTQPLVGSGRS